MRITGLVAGVLLAATIGGAARADVVVSSLPYPTTDDWTRGAMNPGNTYYDGTQTVLETNPYAGNFFGWGLWYANTPGWTPGSSSQGNHLSLTAKFSEDAEDWSAYFYDNASEAAFLFNPTDCSCYAGVPARGVTMYFGGSAQFVPVDTRELHTYEFLLKDGVVSYRIDGEGLYGAAIAGSVGAPLLVIGDGSGTTGSGVGSMTITAVSFDNAPQAGQLAGVTPVPEPGEWAMIAAGLGVIGFVARRRATRR